MTSRSHPVALAGLSAVAAGTTLVSLLTWHGFTESFGETLVATVRCWRSWWPAPARWPAGGGCRGC